MKTSRMLLGADPIIPSVCAGAGEPGLVSVLIPSFNRGYILGPAIDSVLAQTYHPIEVVVVDDGSTDETRAVVERFGTQARYIYQDNAGLAAARNTGLATARGEFIAFQDSDDVWLPWKLQVQVALLRRFPEVALVGTDMTAINSQGAVVRARHLRQEYAAYEKISAEDAFPNAGLVQDLCPDCPAEVAQALYRRGDIFCSMFMGNLIHPPTALMRRDQVHKAGGLDETFTMTCEDYEFFWRLSRQGLAALVDAPCMLYRVGAEDQITNRSRHLNIARGNLFALTRRLEQDKDRINLPDAMIRQCLAGAYAWLAEEELGTDSGWGAAGHFWKSLCLNFFQKRALLLFPFSLMPRPFLRLARLLKSRLGAGV